MTKREFTAPNGEKRTFNYREGTNDENTIIACFEQDYYKVLQMGLKSGDFVIDLGAHLGGVSLLASTIPGVKVVAVEALPENYDLLAENCLNGVIKCYQRAIWPVGDIEVDVSYGDDGTENGRVHNFMGSVRTEPTKLKTVKVKTITLEQLLKQNGIDQCKLLKIDVEGAEENLFETVPSQFDVITGEYHNADFDHFFPYKDSFNIERGEYGYFICRNKYAR